MTFHRIFAAVAFAAVLSLSGMAFFGFTPGISRAQDDSMQGHPIIGTWVVDNDLTSDTDAPETITFNADGTLVDVQGAYPTLGVWEPTGPTTVNVTFSQYWADDEGIYQGGTTIRATGEVSADGTTFTADYTLELLFPDGTSSGQAGPGQVSATRMAVEAPGEPIMSIDELTGPPEASPEATPAS